MDLPDRHQANDFLAEAPPNDPFYNSIPQQLYNHALQNAWVSFRYRDFLRRFSFINVNLSQDPPAPGHGQPEDHHEDIPLPVGGPHRTDMAHQGIVDYHPQPLAVSNFHSTATGTPHDQWHLGNRTLYTYFLMRDMRKVPQYKFSLMHQWVSIHFSLNTCSSRFTVGESRILPLWPRSPPWGTRPPSGCISSSIRSRYPYSQPTETRGSPTTRQSLLVPSRCTDWDGQRGKMHRWSIR
jgi:hypothetical protein